jgi:hypothetical protein
MTTETQTQGHANHINYQVACGHCNTIFKCGGDKWFSIIEQRTHMMIEAHENIRLIEMVCRGCGCEEDDANKPMDQQLQPGKYYDESLDTWWYRFIVCGNGRDGKEAEFLDQ